MYMRLRVVCLCGASCCENEKVGSYGANASGHIQLFTAACGVK